MDGFDGNGYAVIGANFGDEGKGLVTDFICSTVKDPLVIRFSGGQQAGHTVVFNGKRHVFSNFGSGAFRGAPTYWAPTCTFDPVGAMRELKILLSVGVNPMLYVDEMCPVTTPYDKMHNRQRDRNCGHGTCGVGVGATVEREESMASLLAGDLCSRFVFESKLASVERHYDAMYGKSMKIVRKGAVTVVRMADPRVIPVSVDEFYEALAEMVGSPHIRLVRGIPDSSAGKNRVFEGSQGLMLDPRIGVFPHVTRTRTGTENVLRLHADPTVFVVTRAYLTRHGAGPMPNDGMPHNISTNPDETNANNAWQGEFRRALLDVDTLKYAIGRDEYIRSAHKKVLVVTCLDHVRGDYRYTRGGEIVQNSCEEEFVKGISDYLGFGVVYVSDGPVACDVRSFKTRE